MRYLHFSVGICALLLLCGSADAAKQPANPPAKTQAKASEPAPPPCKLSMTRQEVTDWAGKAKTYMSQVVEMLKLYGNTDSWNTNSEVFTKEWFSQDIKSDTDYLAEDLYHMDLLAKDPESLSWTHAAFEDIQTSILVLQKLKDHLQSYRENSMDMQNNLSKKALEGYRLRIDIEIQRKALIGVYDHDRPKALKNWK